MLLVFSHFSVSGPLLTNLPSFPPGQTALSTPSVPVGLGSFPESVPRHPLRPPTSVGPSSAICRAIPRVSVLIWVLPREVLDAFFSWFLEFSLLLNFSELDLPSCLAKCRFLFFLNPKLHWKTPQLSFSRASEVLVLWQCPRPPRNSASLTSPPSPLGLHPPKEFWDDISSRSTSLHMLRTPTRLHFIFHCSLTFFRCTKFPILTEPSNKYIHICFWNYKCYLVLHSTSGRNGLTWNIFHPLNASVPSRPPRTTGVPTSWLCG